MVYLDDRMLLLVTGLVAVSSLAACLWRYWFYFRQLVRCSCKKAVKKYDAIPEYWKNAGKSLNGALDRSNPDYFDDIYPVPLQNREVLQLFLNETSTNEEIHFQLVRAVRVEHSRLWSEYQSLAQEIGRPKLSFKGHGAPTTNQALESVESWGAWYGGFVHALDEDICEAYLFHGTEPHSALKIVEGGFQLRWKEVWNRRLLFRRSRSSALFKGGPRGGLRNVAARGQMERVDVHTVEALPQREHRRLKEELSEVYLFYGTSPQNVMYIAHHGFPVTMWGDMFGYGFGEGAYLHEDASLADKRSSDDKNGYYQGYYAMLLCRVTLGAVQILQKPDADAHLRVGPDKDFDSTIGSYGDGHSGVVMLRREFVVTEHSQIYPESEYAIVYERLTETKQKSKCGEQRVLLSDRAEGERILLLLMMKKLDSLQKEQAAVKETPWSNESVGSFTGGVSVWIRQEKPPRSREDRRARVVLQAVSDEPEIPLEEIHKEKKVGAGSFGAVWKAHCRGQAVAVKYCQVNKSSEVLIVMEFMSGGSLQHILFTKKTFLSFDRKSVMARQIAEGLSFLHDQNVVHRDLKTANVILDDDLSPSCTQLCCATNCKICDFGLTITLDRTHLTVYGLQGSPRYMAPEQLDANEHKPRLERFGHCMNRMYCQIVPFANLSSIAAIIAELLVKKRGPIIPEKTDARARVLLSYCLRYLAGAQATGTLSMAMHQKERIIIFVNAISYVQRLSSVLALLLESPSASKVLSRVQMSNGGNQGAPPGLTVDVLDLHSKMRQKDRLKRIERFRKLKDAVLVCTDIAARGLDVPDVSAVIHFQAPRGSEVFVHRSGRTARAGREGQSIAFVAPTDVTHWNKVYRAVGIVKDDIERVETLPEEITAAKEASRLAAELEKKVHQTFKQSNEDSWLKKAAREADLMLDEEDDTREVGKSKAPSRVLWGLFQEMQARLRRPPRPSGSVRLSKKQRLQVARRRVSEAALPFAANYLHTF
eukprot:s2036_g2.t2